MRGGSPYPDDAVDDAQSRSWRLNAALLDMVRRAFELLDREGLTFEGLPLTFQNLDALQTLDGLALAAHEAVERHGDKFAAPRVMAMRSAIDLLWRASTLSDKFRALATSRTGPTMNDIAEVALLAATAGEMLERRANGAAPEVGESHDWSEKIAAARAARSARVRANWERLILEQCREMVAETPQIETSMLAANICTRNGVTIAQRRQVHDLIIHWRNNGMLDPAAASS
jgi:hypothetical protein